MEWIDGVTMLKLQGDQLSEEQKSNVMVKAIEAEVAIKHHGVVHQDLLPETLSAAARILEVLCCE
jgi:RIO-like serine/threonine protein kinase